MNIIPDVDALSTQQEAKLIHTALYHWRNDPQVIQHGAIIICRRGQATLTINFKEWELFEGAVITVFPGDVVHLRATDDFETETLRYNASLLREASLQLEQTVYNAMREDRCRQDTPIVTHIINNMFGLLHSYFDQPTAPVPHKSYCCNSNLFSSASTNTSAAIQSNTPMRAKPKG
ncbi:MAG: AraC family ligand binding domain-containing protein [Prevotella sp.]